MFLVYTENSHISSSDCSPERSGSCFTLARDAHASVSTYVTSEVDHGPFKRIRLHSERVDEAVLMVQTQTGVETDDMVFHFVTGAST